MPAPQHPTPTLQSPDRYPREEQTQKPTGSPNPPGVLSLDQKVSIFWEIALEGSQRWFWEEEASQPASGPFTPLSGITERMPKAGGCGGVSGETTRKTHRVSMPATPPSQGDSVPSPPHPTWLPTPPRGPRDTLGNKGPLMQGLEEPRSTPHPQGSSLAAALRGPSGSREGCCRTRLGAGHCHAVSQAGKPGLRQREAKTQDGPDTG